MSELRLSDLVSVGLLTKVFPPELADEVINGESRTEQRHRLLTARCASGFLFRDCVALEGVL